MIQLDANHPPLFTLDAGCGPTFKRYSGQWICKHLARDYDTSQSGTTTPMTPISSEHKTCNGDVVVDSAAGHQLDYAPTCLGMLWKRPILWVACQLSDLKKTSGWQTKNLCQFILGSNHATWQTLWGLHLATDRIQQFLRNYFNYFPEQNSQGCKICFPKIWKKLGDDSPTPIGQTRWMCESTTQLARWMRWIISIVTMPKFT